VWRGTIAQLAGDRVAVEGDGPATLVIGDVAAFALTAVRNEAADVDSRAAEG
jgi:hypothetical protein